MIKHVTITNYRGESIVYDIDGVKQDNPSGLIITAIDGLGPVKANINMTDLTTTDGSIYNSARLEGRNIVIHADFTGASIEDARLLSYKYFPIKKKLTFKIETDNRLATTEGYVESNEPDIFSENSSCVISIVCESPFLLDASENGSKTIDFSNIEPLFEFEFGLDIDELIEFGDIEVQRDNTIIYDGDIETGFILAAKIKGDVRNLSIMNNVTGETFKLNTNKLSLIPGISTNYFINGDDVVINTNQGNKKVVLYRGGSIYNITNLIDRNPTWFKLYRGENVFSYTADEGELNIDFSIEFQIKYEGV